MSGRVPWDPPLPPTWDEGRADKVVLNVAAGSEIKHACEAAGIVRPTFYAWMQRGAQCPEGHPLRVWHDRVQEARATATAILELTVHRKARGGDWRAAAWLLEKRDPDTYGNKLLVRMDAVQREIDAKLDRLRDLLTAEAYRVVLDVFAVDDVIDGTAATVTPEEAAAFAAALPASVAAADGTAQDGANDDGLAAGARGTPPTGG